MVNKEKYIIILFTLMLCALFAVFYKYAELTNICIELNNSYNELNNSYAALKTSIDELLVSLTALKNIF